MLHNLRKTNSPSCEINCPNCTPPPGGSGTGCCM